MIRDRPRIAVCVKQVPDTNKIRIHPEKHTLMRKGVDTILNPLDVYALEVAVAFKKVLTAEITVISMGPSQAEKTLRESLARGGDRAFLLTHKSFAGGDTWATSLTLAACIRKTGPYDLIICGKQAIDGDTAQVGPEIAQHLGFPHLSFVEKIIAITPTQFVLQVMTDHAPLLCECAPPLLMTVVKSVAVPTLTSLVDWKRGTLLKRLSLFYRRSRLIILTNKLTSATTKA